MQEPDRAERAIARRSAEARATVPDLELSVEIDAEPLLAAAQRAGCSTTAVLVAACAGALQEFPRANGAYRDGRFELYSRINVGVTVAAQRGQPVVTVFDADAGSLQEIDEELARLRARVEGGQLTPPEQAGVTFTLNDLGPYGVDRAVPVITPPQAAALTAGAVREQAVVRHGAVVAGHVLSLVLACDHRILFGAQAAGFLGAIARHLEAV